MIPFLRLPTPHIGSLELPWFMLLVVAGIAAGTEFARWRAIRERLSVKVTVDSILWLVGSGFLFAHIVAVVAYHPDLLQDDWSALLPWKNFAISSIGGFLGAAIAIPVYFRLVGKAPFWPYADNLAMAFALGWTFGRAGCFTAHDHIGRATNFFLAVQFPPDWPRRGVELGTRHDLGLYEALLSLTLFLTFLVLDRKPRFHGLYTGLLLVIYAPFRFLFDNLRSDDLTRAATGIRSDPRWFVGLTAAQVGVLALFGCGVWILVSRSRAGRVDTSAEEARDFQGSAPA